MSKATLIREITIGEARELARILAGLDEFQASPRIRKTFVDVNFPEFKKWTGEFNFVGGGRTVAKRFTRKLIDRSIEGKDNSIGKFPNYIIEFRRDTIPRSHLEFISNIIKKYRLENSG